MRLFIAVALNPELIRGLSAMRYQLGALRGTRLRWTASDHLHLTLKFLGEVEPSLLSPLCDALGQAALGASEATLVIERTGVFPAHGPVRIIWAGPAEPDPRLFACVEGVEAACAEVGLAREKRPFHPHVTVARVSFDHSRGALRTAAQQLALTKARQSVREFVLMESVLAPEGARYTLLARFPFGTDETQRSSAPS